jgi:hypothetical protein
MLTLGEDALNWALRHALNFGDTDAFPLPFEYRAIEHDWAALRSFLVSANILDWKVRPLRALLAPKARYGFRVITQLDPLDLLVFAATVREIGSDLEKRRVPVSKQVVFSYRFLPTKEGQLFDPTIGYSAFQDHTRTVLKAKAPAYVAAADIADFYPRIYHHRLKGALEAATAKASHVGAVMTLLKGWNNTETFGIPVGTTLARLLAEIAISDVDEALLGSKISFVRFNDDYRLFADNYTEAYRALAFLANFLFRNHGLTLQPQKTMVLSSGDFQDRFLPSPEDRELASLEQRFHDLVDDLGLADPYQPIDYDNLESDQKEMVNSMNLAQLFSEKIRENDIDIPLIRFILRRLGQLADATILDEALDNLDQLYPVFADIIEYARRVGLTGERRKDVGKRVLDLLDDSIVSELEYHRLWGFNLFAESTDWDNEASLPTLLANARDSMSRRELILAMARAKQQYWFQSQWRNLANEAPWEKRAMIAGFSCLPPDPRRHLYRSIEPQLDPLELAVMRWARNKPLA